MADKIRMETLDPGDSDAPVRLFEKDRIRVGRHEANDFNFIGDRGRYVSSFHAEIYREGTSLYVTDVGSQNGTLVSGVEIEHPTELTPGDVIQFGKRGPMVVASLESWESRLIAQGVFAAKPTEEAEKRVVGEVTLRRVVQEAVETERARNRKVVVIAAVLLVLTIATLTLTMWTKTERTAVPDAPAAVTENESLDPESWANAVERLAPSIFLCYGNDPETGVQALGTAFAIGPEGKLATNAHVVRLLEKLPVRMVVQNDTGRVFPILRMQSHPDYHEATGPDLALLQIDTRGQKLPIVEIATTEELRKLRIGTQLGTLGFPAELQQTYLSRLDRTHDVAPGLEATFKTGWIGRIVNASGVKAGFEESIRIQHSASLSGGTSGSPMFTSNGHVVAINHSGLDYAVVTAEDESKPKKVERILNPAQIGHALRIDVLEKFRNDVRW